MADLSIRRPLRVRITAGIAVILLFCLHAAAQTRIMTLGDSRTAGPSSRDCYRLYLDRLLTAADYSFDLVGTVTVHGHNSRAPDSVFDVDHEGHWGWTIDKMVWDTWTKQGIGTWARATEPDIVLALLGTTDILNENDSAHVKIPRTVREIGEAIDTLRAVNPSIAILLANLYPASPAAFRQADHIDSLNARIPEIVESLTTAESPVVFVDTWTGFDLARDLVDPIHANRTGSMRIAERWLDALWPFFDTVPPPKPTISARAMVPKISGPRNPGISVVTLDPKEGMIFTLTGRRAVPPARPYGGTGRHSYPFVQYLSSESPNAP